MNFYFYLSSFLYFIKMPHNNITMSANTHNEYKCHLNMLHVLDMAMCDDFIWLREYKFIGIASLLHKWMENKDPAKTVATLLLEKSDKNEMHKIYPCNGKSSSICSNLISVLSKCKYTHVVSAHLLIQQQSAVHSHLYIKRMK